MKKRGTVHGSLRAAAFLLVAAMALTLLHTVSAAQCTTLSMSVPKLLNPALYDGSNSNGEYDAAQQSFTVPDSDMITADILFSRNITSIKALPLQQFYANASLIGLENSTMLSRNATIRFLISRDLVGKNSMILYLESEENGNSCYETIKYDINAHAAPVIYTVEPARSTTINETQSLLFSAGINDSDSNSSQLSYKWSVNGKESSSLRQFYFATNYTSEGEYNVSVTVTDQTGLSASYNWHITVLNKDRPPYMKSMFPPILLDSSTPNPRPVQLNDYFADLDKDILKYNISLINYTGFNGKDPSAELSYYIQDSTLRFTLLSNLSGRITFQLRATDPYGLYVYSNYFHVDVASASNQGLKDKTDNSSCNIRTVCSVWDECTGQGLQSRLCTDTDCNNTKDTYIQKRACTIVASCHDGIQNHGETGIDCGGPCGACPTCSDGIMNGKETGVDCGGPCQPCPDCHNGIKDPLEIDVDCSPTYCNNQCNPGQKCNTNIDCTSFNCQNGICQPSTCYDKIKNGNETGVDCGGSCGACPTCFDHIQNQNETGVDCGGPCSRQCVSIAEEIGKYSFLIFPLIFVITLLSMFLLYRTDGFRIFLVRFLGFKKRYYDRGDLLVDFISKIEYYTDNSFKMSSSPKSQYRALTEEFTGIMSGQSYISTENYRDTIRSMKIDFATKSLLIHLNERVYKHSDTVFDVTLPIYLKDLYRVCEAYLPAKSTHSRKE